MARIDREIHMDEPPTQAQERFLEEIAPELHRDEGFVMAREEPGQIVFGDGASEGPPPGIAPERETVDFEGAISEPEGPPLTGGPAPDNRFVLGTEGAYEGLRELTARHIHVDFTPAGSGTDVRIHGHGEHRLRRAIDLLGTPGHWPQVRRTEGAPTEDE